MNNQCAQCGTTKTLRVVNVQADGQNVFACQDHAAQLAAPADDVLAALAWYQSQPRR
ncbi:hypothetical protein ACH44C_33680 [Streptomyces purpureus]|uniref:hypothetical protein n=1 Tax=Streptomyces purpureus TaxID=1951 RepID=UPI0037AD4CC3